MVGILSNRNYTVQLPQSTDHFSRKAQPDTICRKVWPFSIVVHESVYLRIYLLVQS